MKTKTILAAALLCALASTGSFAQGLPTTGTVESREGNGGVRLDYMHSR